MAQPPLSHAIKKLEDALGVQLFQRTSRSVAPTDAGRSLAQGARRVLANLESAVAEARMLGGVSTPLRIGSVPHVPLEALVGFLTELRQHIPAATIRVSHVTAAEQLRALRDGSLDLAILDDVRRPPGIEAEPFLPAEPLEILLAPGHALAARESLGPEDLRSEVLVTAPRAADPALSNRMPTLLAESGYRFDGIEESPGPSIRDLVLAVALGLGVALVPLSLDEAATQGVVRLPLDPAPEMPGMVVAWRSKPPHHVEAVVTVLHDLATAAV
jgi:DNA-binding transcriptional LysR family regulator